MIQKQTVAAVGSGPCVSGAAGSVCPQVEALHGYKAEGRELKGKSGDGRWARHSLAGALRHAITIKDL